MPPEYAKRIICNRIRGSKVKLIVNKMAPGELEGARLDLLGKHHRDELALGIGIRFVFGHCNSLC